MGGRRSLIVLEAIAIRWQAVASSLEAIVIGWQALASSLEAIVIRWQALASSFEAIAIRWQAVASSWRSLCPETLKPELSLGQAPGAGRNEALH